LFIFSDGVYETAKHDGSMWSFKEFGLLLSSLNLDEYNTLEKLYDQSLRIADEEKFEDDYTILKVIFT
jgi:serine phosphatase RsbU (regulator of sigma subunit)